MGDINIKEFEDENLKAETQDLSPAISFAYKNKPKNKDQKEISIQLINNPEFNKNISIKKNNNSPNPLAIGLIFLTAVIIIEILIYIFLKYLN